MISDRSRDAVNPCMSKYSTMRDLLNHPMGPFVYVDHNVLDDSIHIVILFTLRPDLRGEFPSKWASIMRTHCAEAAALALRYVEEFKSVTELFERTPSSTRSTIVNANRSLTLNNIASTISHLLFFTEHVTKPRLDPTRVLDHLPPYLAGILFPHQHLVLIAMR